MHKPHFLLVAPFPGVFIRRSVAYWVLLHLMRDLVMLFMAGPDELLARPADLLPGGNPLVPALVVVLGMLQARRSDEDLYLANLGYGWPVIAAYLLVPAAALEAAFTVGRFGGLAETASLALPLAGLGAVFAA
jgi:ribosomal protein S12 methylthiotransferase accessory factor YcaO